ncbi:MAG: hypothetical protein K0U66_01405 [Gammaproteobacteria bacterium]|nr:hypothetical protein [Gammaproteobacteria bacterium]
MATIRAEVKTGSRFKWTQSLTKPINIADEYAPHGLMGLTAIARIIDARDQELFTFPMQMLLAEQTELVFVCGADETQKTKWVVGEKAQMDILFSNGVSEGRILTPTIVIDIIQGITRPQSTEPVEGSFGADFGDSFRKGASGS